MMKDEYNSYKDSVSILQILVSAFCLVCWFAFFIIDLMNPMVNWNMFGLAYVTSVFSALFSVWIINKKDRTMVN